MKEQFTDLNEFLYVKREEINKTDLARRLRVWPSKLTTLLNPKSYRVALDDELIERIANVLNQSPDYVKRLYAEAA